ncbi:flavodoxin domain-containing protein [Nocardia sp. 004]|uniref:flavodoxin domain-containing protein n=1 Tax=Nocardia sp. 004 TaxID=3385978 RepID=UPI0039A054FB
MKHEKPHIAVVYANEQGATRDIAEFIYTELAAHGAAVELADIDHAPDLSRFDTLVLGSAVRDGDFPPAVVRYAQAHQNELVDHDVWLFGVGLNSALRGPIGRRVSQMVPKRVAALRDRIVAHDYRAFAGYYDRTGISPRSRLVYRLLGGRGYGDLRDWVAIRAWTEAIACSLRLPQARCITIHP